MKIRFVTKFSDGIRSYEPGRDYEVDNAIAIRWIDEGKARKSAEPLTSEADLAKLRASHPNEKVGANADTSLPPATPVNPRAYVQSTDNPAAFRDAAGNVTPSTGFSTSTPDATVSPASDGASPLAGPGTPEAVGTAPAKNKK